MNTNDTKRTAAISAEIIGPCLKLTFGNGDIIELHADRVNPDIQIAAMMHGFKQKLVDAGAISRNPETGRAASVEDKYNAVKTVFDRLLTGQWNATREGGGATGGLLLQALCRMYDGRKTPDELRDYLAGKSDAEKTALRKNPKVATIIDTIRVESGKSAGIDSEEMLDELNG